MNKLAIRRRLLYPAELPGHVKIFVLVPNTAPMAQGKGFQLTRNRFGMRISLTMHHRLFF